MVLVAQGADPADQDDRAEFDTDEEAQLLQREDFEFEDNISTQAGFKRTQEISIFSRLKGPNPPQIQTINPFFASAQGYFPDLIKRRFPGRQQALLLCAVLVLWLVAFIISLSAQLPITDGTGIAVTNLDCVDTLWKPKNGCGIDGIDCRPFNNTSFPFKCPAKCASVKVLNPRAVGPLDVNYRPLVIGTDAYRGDSFICASAIHAGIINDSNGGCGRVTLLGRHDNFTSAKRHYIESIPFDSYFPLAFTVASDQSTKCPSDPRIALLYVDIIFTAILSVFASSPTIFFPIFIIVFAHVAFASDPPSASFHNITVLPDHISMFAKRLLPALFCAVIIYRTTVRRTLQGLTAHMEKTVLWLGGVFFGALSNYTFDWIPIQRLTAHDLEQQPGAKLALAMILAVLVAIIAGQIYYFWLEGRLLRYLALYGLFIAGILVCVVIPGVSLRIHHYIIGLLLLPGTSLQTRPSLVYQGILLGLFINGVARWDFDSVLQTTDDLRGDGKFESALPELLEPIVSRAAQGLVATFKTTPPPGTVDGISILVNDVERARKFFSDGVEESLSFVWNRTADTDLSEYFRFGFVRGGRALDYTVAGTLFGDGTWSGPERG